MNALAVMVAVARGVPLTPSHSSFELKMTRFVIAVVLLAVAVVVVKTLRGGNGRGPGSS